MDVQDNLRIRNANPEYDQMANIGGFSSFSFQKQPQQPQILQHNKRKFCLGYDNGQPGPFAQPMDGQVIENHNQGIEGLIYLQNERLKMVLQEQNKQHIGLILAKYEQKMQYMMQQKEQEIAKAAKRNMELEDLLRKIENENQMWEKVAKDNQNMADFLNNKIEEIKESVCFMNNAAENAESCCVGVL